MDNIVFEEQQRFRQKWMYLIYILLTGLLALFLYADTQQIILGKSFGDKPAPDFVLIIATLFHMVILLLFYFTKLETRINKDGIFYRCTPFNRKFKKISRDNISKAEIIKYGFVGWLAVTELYSTLVVIQDFG